MFIETQEKPDLKQTLNNKKMKKVSLIVMLGLMANLSFSQEMKTLFKKDTTKGSTYGGYGAPFVGAGMLNDGNKDSWGTLVGGKGGLIKNHHFAFGGIGAAVIGNSSTSMLDTTIIEHSNDTLTPYRHNMFMGYGGIFIEYIFNFNSPVHVSLPLNICAGGLSAAGKHSDGKVRSSAIFVVEPGINFEFNFSKHFVPALNIGYRIATGNSTASSKAASGLNVAFVLKFGKF